ETLVFRMRDFKKDDVVQIALEDSISAASDPIVVAQSETPIDHVKVERFGKGSLGLRRCPEADQSSRAPLSRPPTDSPPPSRQALGVRVPPPPAFRGGGAAPPLVNS